MKSKPASLPEALDRHLSAASREDLVSTARYIDLGGALVAAEAMDALQRLLPAVRAKAGRVEVSPHLARRLEVLALYFQEGCGDGQRGTVAHREAAFALLYFLKGFDRIPDTVPEIGLLDDAMIVQIVLQRHAEALRTHWLRRRRAWPAEL